MSPEPDIAFDSEPLTAAEREAIARGLADGVRLTTAELLRELAKDYDGATGCGS